MSRTFKEELYIVNICSKNHCCEVRQVTVLKKANSKHVKVWLTLTLGLMDVLVSATFVNILNEGCVHQHVSAKCAVCVDAHSSNYSILV